MAKTQIVKQVLVQAHLDTETYDVVRCDKCGREIYHDLPSDDTDEELYAQELVIELNPNLCVVDALIRQDYCKTCLEPIWHKICEALGLDPHDQHRIGQDDD